MSPDVLAIWVGNALTSAADTVTAVCLMVVMRYHGKSIAQPQVVWVFTLFFLLKALSRILKTWFISVGKLDEIATIDLVLGVYAAVVITVMIAVTVMAVRVPSMQDLMHRADQAERDSELLRNILENKQRVVELLKSELVKERAVSCMTQTSPIADIVEQLEQRDGGQ